MGAGLKGGVSANRKKNTDQEGVNSKVTNLAELMCLAQNPYPPRLLRSSRLSP